MVINNEGEVTGHPYIQGRDNKYMLIHTPKKKKKVNI